MGMLSKLPLEKVVVTNTICQTEHLKQSGGRHGKLEIMDISPVLAESIRRVSPLSTICYVVFPESIAHSFFSRSSGAQWRKFESYVLRG